MIEKKSPKGNLEKRRKTFLLIGFIVVLGLIYAAFELYASKNEPKDFGILDDVEIFVRIDEVISTDPVKPPPPAPTTAFLIKPVDTDPIIKINMEGLFPGYDIDFVPGNYDTIPLIDDRNEPAPPERFPEVLPEPIGGFETLYGTLKSNLTYPKIPLENHIHGTVFVQFVVERDGSITEVSVISGVHPDLDKEAVRVVNLMPKWTPGQIKGKVVRSYHSIPIRFIIGK
jgi:protein TonB